MNAGFESLTISGRAALIARNATPGLLTMALVFLTLVPYGIPNSAMIVPPLALMSVYFWAIHRPDLLPAPGAFAIGLFQDILSGGPPGLYAFVFLVLHSVLSSQRRFFLGRVFIMEWLVFALVAPFAFLVIWILSSVYYGAFMRPGTLMTQGILTVAIYPVLTWAFIRFRRLTAQP
jgi:rod shape-determining protein MreD